MPKETRSAKIARATLFLEGVERYFAAKETVQIQRRAYTKAQILARLRGNIAKVRACDAAFAAFRVAVRAERSDTKELLVFLRYLKLRVRAVFAEDEARAAFGLRPLGPGYKSVETKKAAAEKSLATRAARRTMGKRQKAKIKGAGA